MPVIARLDGIAIRMYFQQEEHNPPHIHAIYGEDMIAVDIRTGGVLDGSFSHKSETVVRQWVLRHQDALLRMWETQEFVKIVDSAREA